MQDDKPTNPKQKAPGRFELPISCLLDRRFNQLSHGANIHKGKKTLYLCLFHSKINVWLILFKFSFKSCKKYVSQV